MAKAVYSLALDENVIRLVDAAAHCAGMSRSNYVNRVLAESVGYETAEQRIENLFSAVENLLKEHGNLHFFNASSGMATVTGSIACRYRPKMKYAVEIYPENGDYLGEVKISSRTGNGYVKNAIEEFYRLWGLMEERYVSADIPREISDGRMRRVLLRPSADLDSADLAQAIAHYIDVFDALINEYFTDLESGGFSAKDLEYAFRRAFYMRPAI